MTTSQRSRRCSGAGSSRQLSSFRTVRECNKKSKQKPCHALCAWQRFCLFTGKLPASCQQVKYGISFYSIFKPVDALMGLLCGCFHRRQAGYHLGVGFALLSLLGFDFVSIGFYISKLGADRAGGMPAGCVILAGSASHLHGGGHDAVHRPRCADKRDDDADGRRHQASPPSHPAR